MSSIIFLLLAFALSALGTAVLVWRNRQPNRIETGINDFQREMQALSPESRRVVMPGQAPPTRRPLGRAPSQVPRDDSGE